MRATIINAGRLMIHFHPPICGACSTASYPNFTCLLSESSGVPAAMACVAAVYPSCAVAGLVASQAGR